MPQTATPSSTISSTDSTSAVSTETADIIAELVNPVVEAEGFAVYDLRLNGSTLQVLVTAQADKTAEAAAPDAADLTQISRALSRKLDEQESTPFNMLAYTLEVSTPGLERKLTKPDHFASAIGETVTIKLTQPRAIQADQPATRRLEGVLLAISEDDITVSLPSATSTISLSDIASARTIFDWGTAKRNPAGKQNKQTKPNQNQPSSEKGATK